MYVADYGKKIKRFTKISYNKTKKQKDLVLMFRKVIKITCRAYVRYAVVIISKKKDKNAKDK